MVLFVSFIAATPLETNDNLLVKHGFDQTYQKSKKVKESLSSFLPHLPGKASSFWQNCTTNCNMSKILTYFGVNLVSRDINVN